MTHPSDSRLTKATVLKKQNKQPLKRVAYINYPNGKKRNIDPISQIIYIYKINFRLIVDLN